MPTRNRVFRRQRIKFLALKAKNLIRCLLNPYLPSLRQQARQKSQIEIYQEFGA